MKILEYILKFGFMFGLSVVLMLYGGPAFYKKVESDQSDIQIADGLLELKLSSTFDSEEYIQFSMITRSNDTLIKNYFVPEKEYLDIVSFLFKNQLIQNEELLEFLPVKLKKGVLKNYTEVKYRLKKNNIESLSINGQYLIGGEITILKKVTYYTIGAIISLLGVIGFLISSITLIDCIKTYQNTGTFPSLPNSINSKIEGFKYIFRGFNSKKK